ncbi:MAG: sigma-70 family RNA polymerase sigma factor [Oligoflexia bacterium]|nr:sigma-70 family RNA polymerase sigma factor [Oligoflexia bacterium]
MHLYTRYGPALLRKCERMLGSRADAEDVVQSLFVDLLRKGRTDVGLAYLYQAATRRSLNLMRDGRRRDQLLAEHGDVLVPHQTNLDEQVISAQIVRRLVGQLDPLTAEIVVYAYLDRMSQDEISAIVGLSRKTVGKRLAGARQTATALAEGSA